MITNDKNSKIRDEIKTLKRDLYTLKDDLEQISNSVVEEGKETLEDVKEKTSHQIKNSLKVAREHVQERPISSTVMAAGAGLLLGSLLNRK